MIKRKVMIVDDSAFMRKVIGDMISRQEDLEVIETARDGLDALKKLEKIHPDVITLDVEMPNMNGLMALKKIHDKYHIPVIMLSSLTTENSKITIEALAKGAYDFVEKPSGAISLDMEKIEKELVNKIRSTIDIVSMEEKPKGVDHHVVQRNSNLSGKKYDAVVIGASTGGPKAITEILNKIPMVPDSIPIFIVQHMPRGFTASFAQRLDSHCTLKVKEAQGGEKIQKGHIYIAPGDYHMTLNGNTIKLDQREKILGVRPSVDYLFQSAAPIYKDRLLAIVLTGMGRDGTQGMKEIKKWGGTNIAQDRDTSVIFGMPGNAIANGVVNEVLPIKEISQKLNNILKG